MGFWGKINRHLLLEKLKIGVATLEISIKDSKKKARNKSSYLTCLHIPKDSIYLYTLSIDTCSITLIATLLSIARIEKEMKCPSTDEWVMKCGIYTRVNIIHL